MSAASNNYRPLDDMADIRKMGLLVKLKTNKKKFFVLREKSSLGPARLEYYDSEKKFRSRQVKRCIDLESCLHITRKADGTALGTAGLHQQQQQQTQQQQAAATSATARAKQFAIVLFTKDDCFTVGCESEEDQLEWLTKMTELRNAALDPEAVLNTPQFEHIWQVSVKPKELGNEKKISPGEYRFCLTNNSVSFIRLNEENGLTIPLPHVKKVGHSNLFVMLEFGRASITGPGSLWMQVEDSVIAQNIHHAVLGSMKTEQEFRLRSSSINASATRMERERQRREAGGAASAQPGSSRPQRAQTIHVTQQPSVNRQDVASARPIIDRRSLQDPALDQFDHSGLSPTSSVLSVTPEVPGLEDSAYMPMSPHDPTLDVPGAGDSRAQRRSSPTSHIGVMCNHRRRDEVTSLAGRSPVRGYESASDYLDMSPVGSVATSTVDAARHSHNATRESAYLNMAPLGAAVGGSTCQAASDNVPSADYINMSPAGATSRVSLDDVMTSQASGGTTVCTTGMTTTRSSGNLLTAGGGTTAESDVMRDRSGSGSYMIMSPSTRKTDSQTLTVSQLGSSRAAAGKHSNEEYVSMTAPGSEGYLMMSARHTAGEDSVGRGSSSSVSSAVSSAGSSVTEQPQDPSFRSLPRLPEISTTSGDGYIEMMSPAEELIVPYERPRLATVHCYIREETEEFPYRTFSVGSKPFKPHKNLNSSHYVDMSGRKVLLNKAGRPFAVAVNIEEYKRGEKSSSAPHLSDELSTLRNGQGMQHKPPQHSPLTSMSSAGDGVDDRFMMLDFDRGKSLTTSKDEDIGDMPRLRTSSGGSRDLRSKAFSFSGAFTSLFKRSGTLSGQSNRFSTGNTAPNNKNHKTSTSRVRNDSFGLSAAQLPRPRASTEGHAGQLRESMGVTRKTSEGATCSTDAEYIDMALTNITSSSGYMEMKPGCGVTHTPGTGTCRDVESTLQRQPAAVAADSPYMDLSLKSGVATTSVTGPTAICAAHSSAAAYMEMCPAKQAEARGFSTAVAAAAGTASTDYIDMRPGKGLVQQSVVKSAVVYTRPAAVTSSTLSVSCAEAGVMPSAAAKTCVHSDSVAAAAATAGPYMSMIPGQAPTAGLAATAVTTSVAAAPYMSMTPGSIPSASDTAPLQTTSVAPTYVNLDYSSNARTSVGTACVRSTTQVLPIESTVTHSESTVPQLSYASLDLAPSQGLRHSAAGSRSKIEHVYAEIDFSIVKK